MFSSKQISVCYLARFSSKNNFPNEMDSLFRFVKSYKKYDSGIEHTLWILVKGALDFYAINIIKDLDIKARFLLVPSERFDLGSYTEFANLIRPEWFFILNSNSEIICDNWLVKYCNASMKYDSPAVGSTASFGSYADGGSREFYKNNPRNIYSYFRVIRDKIYNIRYLHLFSKYPSPHVRTNALFVKVNVWLEYFEQKRLKTKLDCYIAESGNDSFYNFVVNKYGKFGIIGADDVLRLEHDWYFNGAFRTPLQNNYLIVSDNQTKFYSKASLSARKRLQFESWRNINY